MGSDSIELLELFKFPEEQQTREFLEFRTNWGTKQSLVKAVHTKLEAFTSQMATYLSQIRETRPNIFEMAEDYIAKEC